MGRRREYGRSVLRFRLLAGKAILLGPNTERDLRRALITHATLSACITAVTRWLSIRHPSLTQPPPRAHTPAQRHGETKGRAHASGYTGGERYTAYG